MTGEIHDTYFFVQDTIPVVKKDSLQIQDTSNVKVSLSSDTILPALIKSDSANGFVNDSGSIGDSVLQKAIKPVPKVDSVPKRIVKQEIRKSEVKKVQPPVFIEINRFFQAYDSTTFIPETNFLSGIEKNVITVFKPAEKADFFIHEGNETAVKMSADKVKTVTGIEKKPRFFEERHGLDKDFQSQIWLLIPFLLILIQMARVRYYYGKLINPVILSVFNYQSAGNLYRNRNSFYQRASIALNMIFFMTGSLFLYQFCVLFELELFNYPPFVNYLILFAFIVLWFISKWIITRLTGLISETGNLFNEYFFNVSLYFNSAGLLLIPITLLGSYAPYPFNNIFIYIGLGLLLLLYVLRSFRLFVIFYSKRVYFSYGILYLCALEILPFLVLVKVLLITS
jgi:hypothetical protein